jgi:hypothetical protein
VRALASLVLYVALGVLAVAVAAASLADGRHAVAVPLLVVLGGLSLLLGYARPFAGAVGPPLLVCVLAVGLFTLTSSADLETRGWGSGFLVAGLVAGELLVLVGGLVGGLVRGVRRVVAPRGAVGRP